MNPQELFRAGKLSEAIKAITDEVRQNPLDGQRRTFLFELLCFAGDFDRAEKQLDALAQGGQRAGLGALLYGAALHAERERERFFAERAYLQPGPEAAAVPGAFNGRPFRQISDADPRVGAHFEVFLAGRYLWVPFAHIASLQMEQPKRLRDLLWAPVLMKNGPSFQGRDLGEALAPVLAPFTHTHADDNVRLGRATVWEPSDDSEIPFGQKMLLVDGEEVPLLELRTLEISAAGQAAAG